MGFVFFSLNLDRSLWQLQSMDNGANDVLLSEGCQKKNVIHGIPYMLVLGTHNSDMRKLIPSTWRDGGRRVGLLQWTGRINSQTCE
jgi:hypothetical protein